MKVFKKAAALGLTLALSLSMFGCGLIKKKDTTPWQDKIRDSVPDKMTEENIATFNLEGEEYTFPMKVSELLDNGWTYDNSQFSKDKVDSYSWYKYKVELTKDKKNLTFEVYNTESDSVDIKDCLVGYITLDKFSGQTMFAGELYLNGNEQMSFSDGKGLYEYCEEGFTFEDEDISSAYSKMSKNFHDKDGRKCIATFTISGGAFTGVTYDCSFSISNLDYSTSILDSVMKNDPTALTDLNSQTDGVGFVSQYRQWLAEDFAYYTGFNLDELTEEEYQKLYQYMDIVYGAASYTIDSQTTSEEETILITYFAPDDFDTRLGEMANATFEAYEGDTSGDVTVNHEFFDVFLDQLIIAAQSTYTYSTPHMVTLTYRGEEDNEDFDNGLYDILLNMLGLYEDTASDA